MLKQQDAFFDTLIDTWEARHGRNAVVESLERLPGTSSGGWLNADWDCFMFVYCKLDVCSYDMVYGC